MQDVFVHESAFVDDGAQIGAGSKVWHFCHVMGTARLGERCILGQNVFVGADVVVGDGVKIQNNVSLYKGVVVEDEAFLGPSMVFTNVMNPRSAIERKDAFLPTVVGKGASIGANATLVCGNSIGAYAFIGAGAVVLKDVPAYALMVGAPARQIGWVSQRGVRLEFNADGCAQCPESGERYRLVEGAVVLDESTAS